jgi:hypothetical protein
LNLSLVRNDLDDDAVAILEHQFPGLGVRLAAVVALSFVLAVVLGSHGAR